MNGTALMQETSNAAPKPSVSSSSGGLMATLSIPLSKGKIALIDDQDADLVMPFKWYSSLTKNTTYAIRGSSRVGGKQITILMHRVILDAPPGMFVDHRDGDGLNNCRDNLRLCTRSQNEMNKRIQGGTSRFKGVCWHGKREKWEARIGVNRKRTHLGYFTDETEAAMAYDVAARELFDEFARLNGVGPDLWREIVANRFGVRDRREA
jgi:hypothetical protein